MKQKYNSCIIILADGARWDFTQQLLLQGALPNISKYLVEPGAFAKAISVFPSTTGPAHLPFITGCYPGTCNVPGIRWLDRKEYDQKKFGKTSFRSYVGPESRLMNSDLDKKVATLFDVYQKPISIFNAIDKRGNVQRGHSQLSKWVNFVLAHYNKKWQRVDEVASKYLFSAIDKEPDFLFVTFPAIDELSHLYSPFAEPVSKAYQKLDEVVGKLAKKLKNKGKLEQTLILIVSDHGLTETHSHFDLVKLFEDRGIKTFHYPKVYKRNCQAAVMESGNAMAHVYFKNSLGWREKTYHHHMNQINGHDLINLLTNRSEIDMVITREKNKVILVTKKDGQARIKDVDQEIQYTVSGQDPFGYDIKSPINKNEILEITKDTDYPDALTQILQIFKSERTGDMIVISKNGYDVRDRFEWPEHKASHGSLHKHHMEVPLILNYPLKKDTVRTVDVFPSVINLLDKKVAGPIDGEAFV